MSCRYVQLLHKSLRVPVFQFEEPATRSNLVCRLIPKCVAFFDLSYVLCYFDIRHLDIFELARRQCGPSEEIIFRTKKFADVRTIPRWKVKCCHRGVCPAEPEQPKRRTSKNRSKFLFVVSTRKVRHRAFAKILSTPTRPVIKRGTEIFQPVRIREFIEQHGRVGLAASFPRDRYWLVDLRITKENDQAEICCVDQSIAIDAGPDLMLELLARETDLLEEWRCQSLKPSHMSSPRLCHNVL